MRGSWSRLVATVGAGATALVFSLSPAGATMAAGPTSGAVKPNPMGMMDCNGHSPMFKSVKVGLNRSCTDPVEVYPNGTVSRFKDNGFYIGHDEPNVKFISSAAGSANDMTYVMKLAVDPKTTPTVTSPKASKYAELSPAPWFGLPLCDNKSYPQNPCTANSDANSGVFNDPKAAGSAFMELQFYAPGFTPFIDSVSCDPTKYCAALTIDSLECTFAFATCNNNCIEPVNFAFLQTNGVPAGPPSPQLVNNNSFFPNARTLKMNQGDVLVVTIRDTASGLLTRIDDLSTHQSGFMVASANNGFKNTNIADCTGTPFDFHAEYSSAQQPNQVPWAALEGGVLMQQELGHFEPCSSVTSAFPVNQTFAGGQTFSDPNVFQVCQGGFEKSSPGEGPCSTSTGVCVNATTQGGVACPSNNFTSGASCEFSDANCMPAGSRTIVVNGQAQTARWPIAGCQTNVFQNGDLDFEGSSYQADYPDGSPNHPTSFQYVGPFSKGATYPTYQFQTNVAGSEITCNVATGAGCTALPQGAAFYPIWTLGSITNSGGLFEGLCAWNFGSVIPGVTKHSFGGTAEYGTPDVARFGGTLTSTPAPNPEFSTRC
jgi:hypothetical protein